MNKEVNDKLSELKVQMNKENQINEKKLSILMILLELFN